MTYEALHSHFIRLFWCGMASVACGFAVSLARRTWRPFATMTVAWGVLDALIALLARIDGRPFAGELIPNIAFNEGLDVAYTTVGLSMLLLADRRMMLKGLGLAILFQGLILILLDGKLWSDLAAASLYK